MIRLPAFPELSSDFDYEIEIGGQILTLRFTWNIRVEFWFLQITTPSGQVFGQFKVVPNWPLVSRIQDAARIPGNLFVFKDDASAGDVIGYDDFGTAWGIYYLDASETLTWEHANGLR